MELFTPTIAAHFGRSSHQTTHNTGPAARTLAAVALVVSLVATGCSSTSATAPTTTAAPASTAAATTTAAPTTVPATTAAPATTTAPTTAKQQWVNTDLTPFSSITVVNGVGLLYAIDDAKVLYVQAISPDGKTLWKKPASRSKERYGVGPDGPVVAGGNVVYLRPAASGDVLNAELVAVDPVTGDDVAVSATGVFGSWPFACGKGEACATHDAADGTTRTLVALDQKTGALIERGPSQPADSEVMWKGEQGVLTASSRGNPDEYFQFITGGAAAWKLALKDVFPDGFTSRNGWAFDFDPVTNSIVGAVFGPYDEPNGDTLVEHYSNIVVSLSAGDGHLLWKAPGEVCAGNGTYQVVCQVVGTRTTTVSTGAEKLDGVNSTITQLDSMTGKPKWAIDLGNVWGGHGFSYGSIESPNDESVLFAASGPIVFNTKTGAQRTADAQEVFRCPTQQFNDFTTDLPTATGYGQSGILEAFCTADAKELGTDTIPNSLLTFGAATGKVTLFATPKGVIGYES